MRNLVFMLLFSFYFFIPSGSSQTNSGTLLLGGSGSFQSIDGQTILLVNPNIGYFVANKFVLGLNAYFLKSGDITLTALGPYARGYITTSEKGAIFGQVGYNYVSSNFDGNTFSESGYGLGLGYAAFLNSFIALEISTNYSKYDFSRSNIALGSDSGIFSINLGFQIHFHK